MAEHQPFSVAMCVYGGDSPEYFRAAVESILSQTAVPDEVVIVVDGPVPETLDTLLCSFEKDPVFRLIRLLKNLGHGEARRTSLRACTYPLVALMDADDLSVPTRFEKQLAVYAAQPDLSAVSGQIMEFADDPSKPVGRRTIPCTDAELKIYMKKRCPLNQVAVMLKKDDAERVGGYMDWYCDEDYYLWVRMALAGMKFAAVDETLVYVRVGEEMYARRGGWKYFCSERRLQKYMREHKLISYPTYAVNVIKRLIVQVLMPNRLRGWVFQHFARE